MICIDFAPTFEALTGHAPFPWQRRLFDRMREDDLPPAVDIPTGLGKTAVMAIWLLARAAGTPLPRRLVYVVDRRAVVDQATDLAEEIRERLRKPSLEQVRQGLGLAPQDLRGGPAALAYRDLPISTLRGQHVDNREWLEDPAAPAIIVGTVDMIGSRLLFEGYGVSRRMRPYQAGLMGCDTFVLLDEAHLSRPFEQLLRTIERERRARAADDAASLAGAFSGPGATPAIPPPFRLLPLSATLGAASGSGTPITLEDEDRENETVRKRLYAPKRLTVEELEAKASLDAVLAERAWDLAWRKTEAAGAPVRMLIYCDRRKDAESVAADLRKRLKSESREAAVILFVGGRRVHERETAASHLRGHGLLAGKGSLPKAPVFVVATSAGEVGVDLDADHMVCDFVAWERMVQRLGRVNRRGSGAARVLVIDQGSPEKKSAEEVSRHQAVKALLKDLPPAGDGHQAGPAALEAIVWSAKGRDRIAQAWTPPPLYPALTRPLVDAWSMTSLAEHPGRPQVAPWLRGWTRDDPQTTVIWRRCLPLCFEAGTDTPRDPGTKDVEAFFETAPPHAAEFLEAETWRVADWLKKRAGQILKKLDSGPAEPRDLDGQAGDGEAAAGNDTDGGYELLRPLTRRTPVAILLGSDGRLQRTFRLQEAAGQTRDDFLQAMAGRQLVVDARLGGLNDGLLDAGRDDRRDDLLPTAEDNWGQPEQAEEVGRGVADAGDTSHVRVRLLTAEAQRRELDDQGGAGQPPNAFQKVLAAPYRLLPNEDVAVWLIVERRRDAEAGQESQSVAPTWQSLDEHQAWAEAEAGRIADALGLETDDRTMLMAAARRHDNGKRAAHWQRAFNAREDGGPYAKTPGPVNPAVLNGYRHEFQSVIEAHHDGIDELKGDDQRFHLALHLIAAHHGNARPAIAIDGCHALRPTAAASRASEIARRFARLQWEWGPWGLAWWEALLRAADQRSSRALDVEVRAQRRKAPGSQRGPGTAIVSRACAAGAASGGEAAGSLDATPPAVAEQLSPGIRVAGVRLMAEASVRVESIPVDLLSPGQVLACLGFLEAADILLGGAEGGFDWDDSNSKRSDARFRLQAAGDHNPFACVLEFLAGAEPRALAPAAWRPKKEPKTAAKRAKLNDELGRQVPSETFPGRYPDTSAALPIRLVGPNGETLALSHWADESGRNPFKLYAGNRSALDIATTMLRGRHQPPRRGVAQLWKERKAQLVAQPFSVVTPIGGSFNFDPRGGWTALDAGYSPNDQNHEVEGSPVVEVLAALGLDHARPDEFETRRVRYAVWRDVVPPILARVAVAGKLDLLPQRRFHFELKLTGKNKIVMFAREEAQP